MLSLGALSDKLWEIREQRRVLSAKDSELSKEAAEVEQELIYALQEQKLEGGKGIHASFSLKTEVLPHVEDWDVLFEYVKNNGYFHIMYKRLSTVACAELFAKNGAIPGVVPVTKTSIRLLTRSS